jgi:hypothetical protein
VAISEGRTLALRRDAAEARELELHLQQLAEVVPTRIFVSTAAGHIDDAKPAWQALAGLSADAPDRTEALDCSALLHPRRPGPVQPGQPRHPARRRATPASLASGQKKAPAGSESPGPQARSRQAQEDHGPSHRQGTSAIAQGQGRATVCTVEAAIAPHPSCATACGVARPTCRCR